MKSVVSITVFSIFVLAILSIGYRWYNGLNQTPPAQTDTSSTIPASPRERIAPEIVSETWLNSPTLSSSELRGKVVVIEFWTFG